MEAVDITRLAGISYRQLDTWSKNGYLRAEGSASPGSGRPREWPHSELIVARRMKRLVDAGLTVAAAAEVARRGPGEHQLGEHVVVRLDDTASVL